MVRLRTITSVAVVVFVVMVAQAAGFDPFDRDTDLEPGERKVEIRFYAASTTTKPVRFDVDGQFKVGDAFSESSRVDGYRKVGTAKPGEMPTAKMFWRVDSPEPRRMHCRVWEGNKEITHAHQDFPEFPVAFCIGLVK